MTIQSSLPYVDELPIEVQADRETTARSSAFTGFHIETAERARLGVETRAAFPGLKGSVYRALVIGTRVHVLVTRRLLTATKRRAEHG